MEVYNNILRAIARGKHLFAVLIDPDKFSLENTPDFVGKINASIATHIFVGGSTVNANVTGILIAEIKRHTALPVVLFPGDTTQVTNTADALLFLSLVSGRNPDYLIGKHVEAVSQIRASHLEVMPTGYILIDGGVTPAVAKVTKTDPIPRTERALIVDTAKASELLGMKLIYLEAGSGAIYPVDENTIKGVKADLKVPLIVGGGMRTLAQIQKAYHAGADVVVVGTAFEEDEIFFEELRDAKCLN